MKQKVAIKHQPVVTLKNVSKIYTLHHEKPTFVENVFKNGSNEQFCALDKVNLKIYKGEKVGVIGSNGAGKTTLLKVITGITQVTGGSVSTVGRLVSLIDLSAGFQPDLTGEENIFLNGLIIGMTKNQIRKRFTQIVNFADIGQFIDAPLYTYSQGMKLRLGFAVAVNSDPDILILDEGISVGDEQFREKSIKKIEEFFKAGKTVIVVSHWLDFLKKNCNRIVWMEKGRVKEVGDKEILAKYSSAN